MAIELEYPAHGEAPKAHVEALRRHDAKIRAISVSAPLKCKWKRDMAVQRQPYYRLVRTSDGREIFEQAVSYFQNQEPEAVAREISSALRMMEEKEEAARP